MKPYAWMAEARQQRLHRQFAWAGIAFAAGIILGALLSGCATGTPLPEARRDGEAQAVAIAWRVYGRTDLPPLVRWRQGADLTCTDPNSGKAGFPVPNIDLERPSLCREGLTMSFLECWVAWHGELSFADTAMPHELLHVAQARQGIVDTEHRRPEWQTLLPRAEEAIREAGR